MAVLLLAGLAKIVASSRGGEYPTIAISVAQGLVEIGLGVLYASIWQSRVVRYILLVAFTGFLFYNGYLHWRGAVSCGCYGEIRVAPIFSVGLNAVLLIVVYLVRSTAESTFELKPVWLGVMASSIGLAMTVLAFPTILSRFDHNVTVRPLVIEVENDFNGFEKQVSLVLVNHSDQELRLTGWDSNNPYVELLNFSPLVMKPGQSQTFDMVWKQPPMSEADKVRNIKDLQQFASRQEIQSLKKTRVLAFLNQYGEDFASCLLQERLAESIVDLVINSQPVKE